MVDHDWMSANNNNYNNINNNDKVNILLRNNNNKAIGNNSSENVEASGQMSKTQKFKWSLVNTSYLF